MPSSGGKLPGEALLTPGHDLSAYLHGSSSHPTRRQQSKIVTKLALVGYSRTQ